MVKFVEVLAHVTGRQAEVPLIAARLGSRERAAERASSCRGDRVNDAAALEATGLERARTAGFSYTAFSRSPRCTGTSGSCQQW